MGEPDFPQLLLKVARFKGVPRDEFLDNRQFYGNAFALMRKAERFLIESLPVKAPVKAETREKAREKMREKMREKRREKTDAAILRLLREQPDLNMAELARLLAKAPSTIERAIKKLRESGRLQRIGPDKGGHWQVIE